MDTLRWIFFILIGFIAGVTAKDIRSGTVTSIIIGVAGACIGGGILVWSDYASRLLWRMGMAEYELLVSLVLAAGGAIFALSLFHLRKLG